MDGHRLERSVALHDRSDREAGPPLAPYQLLVVETMLGFLPALRCAISIRNSRRRAPSRPQRLRSGPARFPARHQSIPETHTSRGPESPTLQIETSTFASGASSVPPGCRFRCWCRPGCRDMPLYAAISRSLERKSLIFLRLGFFFASQLRWRSAWRAKLARGSLPACQGFRIVM